MSWVSLQERFVEQLEALGGSAGNGRLREALGWQEETYWQVHQELIDDGTIEPGRGRGGSVALPGGTRREPARKPSREIEAQQAAEIEAAPRQRTSKGRLQWRPAGI